MKILEKALECLYPSSIYCICCGSIIDKSRSYGICDQCIEKFSWIDEKTCKKCGKILDVDYWRDMCPDCLEVEHYFDKGFTCARYGLYERAIMMDYKYSDKSYLGRHLGDMLYDRIVIENLDLDVIIPVPIHNKRMAHRGYNQAAIMAKALAERFGNVVYGDYLERVKDTRPMRNLNRDERMVNVMNSFGFKPGCRGLVSDKNIIIVDDIYTTGSTADAVALLLKEAGANKVYVLTFAAGGHRV